MFYKWKWTLLFYFNLSHFRIKNDKKHYVFLNNGKMDIIVFYLMYCKTGHFLSIFINLYHYRINYEWIK